MTEDTRSWELVEWRPGLRELVLRKGSDRLSDEMAGEPSGSEGPAFSERLPTLKLGRLHPFSSGPRVSSDSRMKGILPSLREVSVSRHPGNCGGRPGLQRSAGVKGPTRGFCPLCLPFFRLRRPPPCGAPVDGLMLSGRGRGQTALRRSAPTHSLRPAPRG